MAKPTDARFGNEKRYISEDQSSGLDTLARPLSLQMGPEVIFLNACGDEDAQALTEAWRPQFRWA